MVVQPRSPQEPNMKAVPRSFRSQGMRPKFPSENSKERCETVAVANKSGAAQTNMIEDINQPFMGISWGYDEDMGIK